LSRLCPGPDAFDHEALEVCDSFEEANTAEIHWIEHFDSTNPEKGFNLAKGGVSEWVDPKSIREKLSEATRRNMTPERRAELSALRKGKPLSAETRAKISSSAKRNSEKIAASNRARGPEFFKRFVAVGHAALTDESYAKISAKVRNPSPETKAKLAEASRGRLCSPETRAKLAEAFKGKSHRPETRARLAEAARRQKRDNNGRYCSEDD